MPAHDRSTTSGWRARVGAGALGLLLAATPSLAVAAPPAVTPASTSETPTSMSEPPAASEPASDPPAPRGGMNDPGLWGALAGNDLVLTLSDGAFRGKLMGMRGNQLVLARAGDGLVVSVPTSEVLRVHAPVDRRRPRGPLPADNGVGLLAGGGVLVGIGAPAFVAGAVISGLCGFCVLFIGLPLLLPGGVMVGAGAGMLKVGADRRRMWQQATYGGRLSEIDDSALRLRGMTLRF